MKSNLEENLQELQFQIAAARANYEIWWVYRGIETNEQYGDILDEYHDFFWFSMQAHFAEIFIHLYKIFDTRPDVASLPSILKAVENGGGIADETIASIRDGIAARSDLLEGIKLLRHKLFAHRDSMRDSESLIDEAKIIPNEIPRLIDFAKESANRLGSERFRHVWAFDPYGTRPETIRMLETLKRAHRLGSADPV